MNTYEYKQYRVVIKKLYKILINQLYQIQPRHILIIGSGYGKEVDIVHHMLPHAMITCVDVNSELVCYYSEKENIEFINSDILKPTPAIEKQSYDLVLAFFVIHLLNSVVEFVEVVLKLQSGGGKIVCADWINDHTPDLNDFGEPSATHEIKFIENIETTQGTQGVLVRMYEL